MPAVSPAIAALCADTLAPLADSIDRQGTYPKAFADALFAAGGFDAMDGTFAGIGRQNAVLSEIGRFCGTTSFSLWCHAAFIWYLYQSPNAALRERLLPAAKTGAIRAATGLSNTLKSLSGIDQHRLRAEKTAAGYRISGTLPWVSHVADGHYAAVTAQLPDGQLVMFAALINGKAVKRAPCPPFIALQGSLTEQLIFDNLDISSADILAQPEQMDAYLKAITPGMVGLQLGMADGIARHGLELLTENRAYSAGLGDSLPDSYQLPELERRYNAWQAKTSALWQNEPPALIDVLKSRFAAAQLALDISQAVTIHSGGRGFVAGQPAGRLPREAAFVAVVTPTMRHLARTIAQLEQDAQPAVSAGAA